MIEYIEGNIATLTPVDVVLDVNGIGYIMSISLNSYQQLQGKSRARLLIHEVIREDQHSLYGFADERERLLFRLLISVSGVGAGTAVVILSAMAPGELESVIARGEDSRLKAIKGIGAKTAQRIIIDLRDKIKEQPGSLINVSDPKAGEVMDEALAALVILGFNKVQSQKVLNKIFAENNGLKVEDVIKRAMAMM